MNFEKLSALGGVEGLETKLGTNLTNGLRSDPKLLADLRTKYGVNEVFFSFLFSIFFSHRLI